MRHRQPGLPRGESATPRLPRPLVSRKRSGSACRTAFRDLVAAFAAAGLSQKISNAAAIQPARAYHPIVDDDPTIAAPHGHTIQIASTNEVGEPVAIDRAGGAVKLGSVEVREPDLDPGRGVIGCAKAKAVAVSDVADHARERLTGAGRQSPFTRIGKGDSRSEDQADKEQAGEHEGPFHEPNLKPSRTSTTVNRRKRKGGGGRPERGWNSPGARDATLALIDAPALRSSLGVA
jgi:hypothetical protein